MAATRKNRNRKTSRKTMNGGKRAMSPWNKAVKRVYEEMKNNDPSATFKQALKEASKRKKAGNL